MSSGPSCGPLLFTSVGKKIRKNMRWRCKILSVSGFIMIENKTKE